MPFLGALLILSYFHTLGQGRSRDFGYCFSATDSVSDCIHTRALFNYKYTHMENSDKIILLALFPNSGFVYRLESGKSLSPAELAELRENERN